MKVTLRIGSLTACFLAIVPFTTGASVPTSPDVEQPAQVRPSALMARITMRDGATRTVKLEGVGCAQSICSRTAIKAKTERGFAGEDMV